MALTALKITQRCRRCRKPMRNDGTDQQPKWVCNNPDCVCYVPPTEEQADEEDTSESK